MRQSRPMGSVPRSVTLSVIRRGPFSFDEFSDVFGRSDFYAFDGTPRGKPPGFFLGGSKKRHTQKDTQQISLAFLFAVFKILRSNRDSPKGCVVKSMGHKQLKKGNYQLKRRPGSLSSGSLGF